LLATQNQRQILLLKSTRTEKLAGAKPEAHQEKVTITTEEFLVGILNAKR